MDFVVLQRDVVLVHGVPGARRAARGGSAHPRRQERRRRRGSTKEHARAMPAQQRRSSSRERKREERAMLARGLRTTSGCESFRGECLRRCIEQGHPRWKASAAVRSATQHVCANPSAQRSQRHTAAAAHRRAQPQASSGRRWCHPRCRSATGSGSAQKQTQACKLLGACALALDANLLALRRQTPRGSAAASVSTRRRVHRAPVQRQRAQPRGRTRRSFRTTSIMVFARRRAAPYCLARRRCVAGRARAAALGDVVVP